MQGVGRSLGNQAMLTELSGGIDRQAPRLFQQLVCSKAVQAERLHYTLTAKLQQFENRTAFSDKLFPVILNTRLIGTWYKCEKLLKCWMGGVVTHRISPSTKVRSPNSH
ncbi:hypothetical protein D3C85_1275430 [compost metagenome]